MRSRVQSPESRVQWFRKIKHHLSLITCHLIFILVLVAPNIAFAICDNPSPDATCSHGISIFGDLKYPANFAHFEYVNPDAPKGGAIRYAAKGSFDSLNNLILKGVPATGLNLTQDTLLVSSSDEAFSEYGLIAESIELAKDKSWVIFNLRKRAKWHDDSPITADDVVFSFNTIMEKANPHYRTYYADIEKDQKLDTHKVKFSFKNNTNKELPLIIGQLPIISKAYYEKHDFSKTTLEAPLTSGPYKVDATDPGKWIRYKRVDNYWGKDLPVNKGQYNFDTITYYYYRDSTIAIEALKAGEYDFRQEDISKVWASAYNIPEVENGKVIKTEIFHEIPTGMQGFVFNTRKNKFSDRRVREAISLTMDFEWSNKNLFFSAYARTPSYFSNSEYAHNYDTSGDGKPTGKEQELLKPHQDQLPEEVFTQYYFPPKTDGSGNARSNLRKAKKILEEAGWKVKEGKLLHKESGEAMEIEFVIGSPAFERVVSPMIRNLEKLGITGSIRVIDRAQYIKRLENFDFDVVVHTFGQSNAPGNEQIGYWHSSQADVKGSNNLAGIKDPVIDALVGEITKYDTREDLIAATRALDRVLLNNHYVIPNWYNRSFRVIYWNKFVRPEIIPKYDLGLNAWWYKEQE